MKTGLFIGRFQPFHNGHLSVVRQMEKECDSLIIAIGSAQYGFYPQNPLTGGERVEIITSVLKKEISKPFFVIPVEDINCYPKYVAHVASLVPRFDLVYTGNDVIDDLFRAAGYEVREVRHHSETCATEVRQRISESKEWKSLVPIEAYSFIVKNKIDERIRRCLNER